MRILVGIPVLVGEGWLTDVFDAVTKEANLLIIDNGSDHYAKRLIHGFVSATSDADVIVNERNVYVNAAWNQIMEYFLRHEEFDQLVIMNSDLIVWPKWTRYIKDGVSTIPSDGTHNCDVEVNNGTTGVFIHLNREMVKLVYPIDERLKVWFGDNWIYERIRAAGYKTVVKWQMICRHIGGGSQTVHKVKEIYELIEQDKLVWQQIKHQAIA